MRLGTIDNGSRDGELVLIAPDGVRFVRARQVAPTLQAALDAWDDVAPRLGDLESRLLAGEAPTEELASVRVRAPLPRAYEWVDGSAYINHVVLVRKARGAEPPPTLKTDPLVYQGGSSVLLGPTDPIRVRDMAWGADFESEVCVILGDTPSGTTTDDAAKRVRLLVLANDVSLRNLIPVELEKGFGFFQSKPATAFSPFAVTPDELGAAWQGGRVHLRLVTRLNGQVVGDVDAGPEMHFSFLDLIAHISKTRAFGAGTILGSGTVSNADPARGISCLAERRMREKIETGAMTTPFLSHGDEVEISMADGRGRNLFGTIRQRVVAG
jgi:fumarylacetoacetate (FAA) hydrolase